MSYEITYRTAMSIESEARKFLFKVVAPVTLGGLAVFGSVNTQEVAASVPDQTPHLTPIAVDPTNGAQLKILFEGTPTPTATSKVIINEPPMFNPTATEIQAIVCIQVIVYAIGPDGMLHEFPNPCSLPEGYKVVSQVELQISAPGRIYYGAGSINGRLRGSLPQRSEVTPIPLPTRDLFAPMRGNSY